MDDGFGDCTNVRSVAAKSEQSSGRLCGLALLASSKKGGDKWRLEKVTEPNRTLPMYFQQAAFFHTELLLRSAVSRRGFPRRDLVLEAVRIEAVESTVRRFSLRIHEEADWRISRCWQQDIVREVKRHPIHLPGPE